LAPGGICGGLGGPHGRHEARMHGVHAHPVLGELHGGRLGHGAHRTLGSVVTHVQVVLADDPGDRRDVHDGATPALPHGGHRLLHAEEDALGVDAHSRVPCSRAAAFAIVRAAEPPV